MTPRLMSTGAVLLIAATMPGWAQTNDNRPDMRGAVELNGTKVPQNPKLPDLNLTNEQREQIRKGVLGRNTEVEFHTEEHKACKGLCACSRRQASQRRGRPFTAGGGLGAVAAVARL